MSRRRCCCDTPITTCEDTSRPIAYVDKYATGSADGTSWTDAYTTIQSAINADGTTHRIYIQGYGKSDIYAESVFANTVDEVFQIIGSEGDNGVWIRTITVNENSCFVRLNVDANNGQFNGFLIQGTGNTVIDCYAEDSIFLGFNDISGSNTFIRCTASNNGTHGFELEDSSEAIECVANSNGTNGFQVDGTSVVLTTCVADANTAQGFNVSPSGSGSLTNCDTTNNGNCGFLNCTLISGNTASGNGTACAGITYCDGSTNPCGICDECP